MEASFWIYDVFYLLGYRMMHVFGTTDGIITLSGLWKIIKERQQFKVSRPWTPWIGKNGDFVGYIKEYNNFVLATVHGQGHSGSILNVLHSPYLITKFVHEQPLF